MNDAEVWISRQRRSGEPCIHGTRMPTSLVASLANDGADIKGLYPWLTDEQIASAVWFEETYTKRRKRKR